MQAKFALPRTVDLVKRFDKIDSTSDPSPCEAQISSMSADPETDEWTFYNYVLCTAFHEIKSSRFHTYRSSVEIIQKRTPLFVIESFATGQKFR